MQMAIKKKLFNEAYVWITLTGQILEALRYMHDEAHIIHNDLKSDNVLVTDSFESTSSIQILIVDFGKATERDSGRKHKLSETQKEDYKQRYPHMAPEVINGMNETPLSDIFAAGSIFLAIYDNDCLEPDEVSQKYLGMSAKCRSIVVTQRPSAAEALDFYKHLY